MKSLSRKKFQAAIEHGITCSPRLGKNQRAALLKVGREATVVSVSFYPGPGCPAVQAGLAIVVDAGVDNGFASPAVDTFITFYDRALSQTFEKRGVAGLWKIPGRKFRVSG